MLRLEAAQREADEARGRLPDQDHNPKGGSPYKRKYGESDGTEQFHGSTEPDHEDRQRGIPAVLQRVAGGETGQSVGGGHGGNGGERSGAAVAGIGAGGDEQRGQD